VSEERVVGDEDKRLVGLEEGDTVCHGKSKLDIILRIMGSHWEILICRKTFSEFYYLTFLETCFLYVKVRQ
jgi:hypothetical protein